MIKSILFDLDGVLVDATGWHYKSFNLALRDTCGFELTPLEHEATFNGLPTKEKLRMLIQQGRVPLEKARQIFEAKQRQTNQVIETDCVPQPAKVAMIRQLAASYRLACVTNSIRQTAELMLRKAGYLPYLEFFLSNEDVTRPKPHPDGFIIAMHKMGVRPEETIVVEDAPKGIAAAKAAGCHVLEILGYHDLDVHRVTRFLEALEAPDGARKEAVA